MATLRKVLRPALLWPALLLLTGALYLFGLGGPFAPTNGDEMVYIHIARMTAESGHWLPLQSELVGTRNTKPPLLIWQAVVASGWGAHWNLMALRLPSIAYTFATTALLAFFAWRLSGKRRTACLAAVLYLLYFSTFRYGRVYLTSAPETFWLALPMWWILWLRLRGLAPGSLAPPRSSSAFGTLPPKGANPTWGDPAPDSIRLSWLAYTGVGIAMGLGAAYKSFALVAPASAAVWCAILWGEPQFNWKTVLRTTAGVTWSALLGVGIFALWFVLDPDPAAVWQEFIVAENAGKMSNPMGYWQNAWNGPYPMWTQLLAYPVNAGLLALTGLGFAWLMIKRGVSIVTYRGLTPAQRVLVAWLLVWLIVFTIPSQRSERYVIPAMPALAIGMALLWQRIGRVWSFATLLLMAPALVLLARIAWVIGELDVGSPLLSELTLVIASLGLLAVFLGLFNARWTRNLSLLACATVYASFSLMVAPLSHPDADYSEAVHGQLSGKRVAVPNGFTGQYENYHFVLPGAKITPFDAEGRNTGELYPDMPAPERLLRLLNEFDAVVWLQDDDDQDEPTCMPDCELLAQRWHVKSRHKSGEITLDNLWYPQEWLFSREWLLVKAAR
jgi:4-amino-4-deoxy-L-arabinose transferase-like glycosyltransferase